MKGKIVKIAFHNVLKHKRRSFFNILTFAINAIALIFLLGLLRGMYNSMYEKNIALTTGHFKIYNKNYLEEKKRFPLDVTIDHPDEVIQQISKVPHFIAASPRIIKDGLISNREEKTRILIYGIAIEREKQVLTVFDKVDTQNVFKKEASILVGKKLADLFPLQQGDDLLLYGQTINKANNLVDVQLTGIYSIGFDYMERNIVFIPFWFAKYFFDLKDVATEIIIKIDKKENVPEVKKDIQKIFLQKYPNLIIRDWKEEAPELIAGAEADYISYAIIFFILLFLAVFIIIDTLTISVFERIPEIGTLRAIGLEQGQIQQMFFMEGVLLSMGGIIVGGILSLALAYFMNVHGIPFTSDSYSNITIPFDPIIKSINKPIDWLIVTMICLGAGMLGALFPSIKASKTNIVSALKRGVR